MSVAVTARMCPRILVLEYRRDPLNFPHQLAQFGLSVEWTVLQNPNAVYSELHNRSYDLVLWRISQQDEEFAALRDFLRLTHPIPPLVVIAAQECRGSAQESALLEMLGHGIRDLLFDDEQAVLSRAISRIIAEQTEHTQAQTGAEFLQTPQALTALVEACPLAVVAVAPDGTVLLWNGSAEKIYGWLRDEVIRKPLPTIPASGEHEFRVLMESQLQGISYEGKEVQRRRKDGSLIDVSLWTAPLRDGQGHIRAKLAISADITEQRRIERERLQLFISVRDAQERAQAMDRFRQLLEAAPDAIVEVDENGKIVLLNTVTEQLFGYSKQELLGQSVDSLVPAELRSGHAGHRAKYSSAPLTSNG